MYWSNVPSDPIRIYFWGIQCFVFYFSSENETDDVDVESVEKDVALLSYRPSTESKSVESYRNSKPPRDPETWEDNINKYVYGILWWFCYSLSNVHTTGTCSSR